MSLQINISKPSTTLTQLENKRKELAVYGKLFTQTEADRLFGQVLHSVAMSTNSLKKHSELTKDYLLYNIKGDEVYLLTNKRVPITPEGIIVPRNEVYRVVSMSVINDLLSFGNKEITYFQKREMTLTITNGKYTAELSGFCPPVCP